MSRYAVFLHRAPGHVLLYHVTLGCVRALPGSSFLLKEDFHTLYQLFFLLARYTHSLAMHPSLQLRDCYLQSCQFE